jgi:nucleoside 2-deoxyribosyltransferase
MKIYFAGPLFSEAERLWVQTVKKQIEDLACELGKPVIVLWPYEFVDQAELDTLGPAAKQRIFQSCVDHLKDADILLALLDGPLVDDGTAWEIGYYYARKKEGQVIIGIRTDFRRAGECEGACVNAMIECSCDRVVMSSGELLEVLRRQFRK